MCTQSLLPHFSTTCFHAFINALAQSRNRLTLRTTELLYLASRYGQPTHYSVASLYQIILKAPDCTSGLVKPIRGRVISLLRQTLHFSYKCISMRSNPFLATSSIEHQVPDHSTICQKQHAFDLDQMFSLFFVRIYPIWDARFRHLWTLWAWVRDIGILVPLLYLHYLILYPILPLVFSIIVRILPYLERPYSHGHANISASLYYLMSMEGRTKLLTLGCCLVRALYHPFIKLSTTVLRARISDLILALCRVIRTIYAYTLEYCLCCSSKAKSTKKPSIPVFEKSEIVCLRIGDPRNGKSIFVHRKILEDASPKLLATVKIAPGEEDRPVCYLQHESLHAVQEWVHWQYYREMNGKLALDKVCDDQLILAYDFAQKYKDLDFMDAIIDHTLLFIQHGSEYETARFYGSPTTFLGRLCLPLQRSRNECEKALAIWKRRVFYQVRNLLRSMIKMSWWESWGRYLHGRFESLAEEERHSRWQRIHDVFWEPNTHYGKDLHTRYCLVCGGLWKEEMRKKVKRTSDNAAYLNLRDQRRRFRNLCDRFVYKQRSTPVTKKLMLHLALVLERGTSYVPRSTAGFLPDFGNELRDLSMMMLDQGDECMSVNPLTNTDPCIYHEHTASGLPCYKKKLPGELLEMKVQIHWTSYIPGVDYMRSYISSIRLPKLSNCPWPHPRKRPMKAPRDFPLPESPPHPGQVPWIPSDPWEDVPLPVFVSARITPAKVLDGNKILADNASRGNQSLTVQPVVFLSNGDDALESSAPHESRQDTSNRHDSGQDKKDTGSQSSNEEVSPISGIIPTPSTAISTTARPSIDRAASNFEPGSRSRCRALSAPARSPASSISNGVSLL
ncbi:hypothetical protein BDV97DRAFT_24585 [Delphinella strobiligena]|nr:hypothetical protein BDV97DRAFT_24585 [Delphinella strobiligena]